MIVITTPTGDIGHRVLQHVFQGSEPVRVIARDPSRIPKEIRQRVEVIQGSHGDAATIEKALTGADALFWLIPPEPLMTLDVFLRRLGSVGVAGKHAEGTICYTTSPMHTIDDFVNLAEELVGIGCSSICIKDMAALLKPQPAYDLVRGIKEACGPANPRPPSRPRHDGGHARFSIMKAIEAGVDIVDTSISSLALGPRHNPTEALVEMLDGTPFRTVLDRSRLLKIKEHFAKIRPRYAEFEVEAVGVGPNLREPRSPGGMISNMESQLRQQGAGDRMQEVLAEVPKVRKEAGYPPLRHALQPDFGTQAVFNVLMGQYKVNHRRVRRPHARLLRRHVWRTQSRCRAHARRRSTRKKPSDHVTAGGYC